MLMLMLMLMLILWRQHPSGSLVVIGREWTSGWQKQWKDGCSKRC